MRRLFVLEVDSKRFNLVTKFPQRLVVTVERIVTILTPTPYPNPTYRFSCGNS